MIKVFCGYFVDYRRGCHLIIVIFVIVVAVSSDHCYLRHCCSCSLSILAYIFNSLSR